MTTRPLITMPASFCVADSTLYLDRVASSTASPYTLESQSFIWPGEQWRVDFSLANITNRIIAGQWKAFGAKLRGSYGIFLLGDPAARSPNGVASGTPVADGLGVQGSHSLQVRGWTPSVNGIMLAGDMLQIGTGVNARLYMNVNDVNSDATGRCTLILQPALRNAPVDGTALIVRDAKGAFNMKGNTFQARTVPGPVTTIAFQAEEVVGA